MSPRRFIRIATVATVAAMLAVTAAGTRTQSQELQPPGSGQLELAQSETPALWFVELSGAPAAEGGNLAALRNEKNAFRAAATAAGVRFTERFAFDTLWNGLSIRIDPAQVGTVARIAGVRNVYPVQTFAIPEPLDPGDQMDLATALAQTRADVAQDVHGLTGAGVRVGVIDTGVDYNHPALGGSGIAGNTADFPNSRVVAGFDFVGDAFNAGGPPENQVPVPNPDPDDCNGHGTHVAGIIGAGEGIRGVAPNVQLGAYRVFGCVGTTSADIMIAAMERALADGMDAVNMSIGAAFQWPQYPTGQAATRLVNRGVVVVASIGNSGTSGLYAASAPGLGDKVIGVASFNNSHSNAKLFRISPDDQAVVFSSATNGTRAVPTSGTYPLARTGTQTSTADACAPLPAGSLAGSVALIRRGTCGFYDKSRHAQLAGALAVVIYNNAAGTVIPNIAPPTEADPPVEIPVVSITQASGNLIDTRLADGAVSLTWTDEHVSTPLSATTAGLISSFSSYGPSPDLSFKPDIGAPGGTVLSTVPIERGSFGLNSGTSMAAPHVAGAVALLLEHAPNTPSQAVGAILQNSAVPRIWSGNPGTGLIDLAHRQGAGMLDIAAAIEATTRIEPGALALGESEFGPVTRTLTIRNTGPAVTYDVSHQAALATGPSTFPPLSFFNAPSNVSFSADSLTVPAGATVSLDVTIAPLGGLPDRSLFGGYIILTPQGGGRALRVPYAGFKGDYQSIPVLVPTPNNFPRVGRQTPTGTFSLLPLGTGGTWTLENAQEVPFILVHLDHQVRRMRMEVFDAATGRARHRALDVQYASRNSAAASFFALPWDGTTVNGQRLNLVPNGQYVIVLSVLKALGDDGNPDHWETWTSPVITIARP
jgi:minor extracellular serine protease Vpr